MNLKARLFFVVLVYFGINSNAQVLSTNEAKVVAVVAAESNAIKALELFADQDNKEEQLQKKYPDCQFYIGLMEGSYEVVQTQVYPQRGTTIIIFNNQPLFRDANMVFTEHYSPGDLIKIGKKEARVISNSKGELILKTQ